MDSKARLQLEVKGLKDIVLPNGFVLMLLVFGAYLLLTSKSLYSENT